MRRLAWLAVLAPACGFRGPALEQAPDDAAHDDGGAEDAVGDAGASPDAATCNGKVWLADFATDPTTTDANGDGVDDWALRDGTPFPTTQLAGGVWHVPAAGKPLDTQPKQPFTTRTLVHVRMRATAATAGHGAVFWVNVGYRGSDDTFAPLFVAANLVGATQDVSLWTKVAGVETLLPGGQVVAATDFADVTLDIDPTNLTASVDGGAAVQLVRQPTGPSSHDAWATVIAFGAASDFDLVRVEVCP